MTYKTLHY